MEWVETTARTVEEAVDLALDQLGVDEQEAEWEVLEEPRPGLFGRIRGQARVRARIQPKAQPSKHDRRDRRRGRGKGEGRRGDKSTASTAGPATEDRSPAEPAAPEAPVTPADEADRPADEEQTKPAGGRAKERGPVQDDKASVEQVAEHLQGFLSGLVEAFGEDAPVTVEQSPDEVVARVDAKLGLLIGPKGQTLEAIQELARVTAQRVAPSEVRIKVDVGSYRAQRQQALERFARQVAEKVREGGKPVALEPMPAADRKIVHDALVPEPGVVTHSDGAEPRRRVIVAPADEG